MSAYKNQTMVTETRPIARPRSGVNRRWLAPLGLGLIVLLGAALRFYQLGAAGYGNEYYAATVKSMLTSWHNFFYAAYEPAGSVSVDKPPLGFWLQAISAAIFGLNGFALALPQALAGVLSLPLLYHLVRRHFGVYAGLLAAFVLAITPVTVATERNNTIDGTLVFALLLAAWMFLKAAETGRLRFLWLGALLVGIGFNIKMMQAYLPLPAFLALYFVGAPGRWWRKGLHLSAAGALILAVSLAWPIAVDLTPPENRPFIGSSQNNTVMELIIGHNGLARLLPGGRQAAATLVGGGGDSSPGDGNGQIPGGGANLSPGDGQPPLGSAAPAGPLPPGQTRPGAAPNQSRPPGAVGPAEVGRLPNQSQPAGPGQPGRPPLPAPPGGGPAGVPGQGTGTGPAGGNPISREVGEPGIGRLVSEPLVSEAGWLFPLAFLGLFAAGAARRWRWPLAERQQALVLWGGWFVVQLLFFSFANLFHAYYLIMFGPPLAALTAIGAWGLLRAYRRRPLLGWGLWLLTALVVLTFQIGILAATPDLSRWLTPAALLLAAAGLVGGLLGLVWRRRWLGRLSLGGLMFAFCLAPLTWTTLTTTNGTVDVNLPRSGPVTGNRPAARSAGLNATQAAILEAIAGPTADQTYLLATPSSMTASPFILATDRAVLTFGGFSGGDEVIDATQLAAVVDTGALSYVLDDGSLRNRKPDLFGWLTSNCEVTPLPELAAAGTGPAGNGPGNAGAWRLYFCE